MSLVSFPVGAANMLIPEEDEGSNLFALYQAGHWYEADLLAAIKARRRGGTFVDIGAGYGNHTVFFAAECHADRVVAVEPYPGCYEILEANVRHNQLANCVETHRALIHPAWTSATLTGPEGKTLPDTWSWSTQPVLVEGGDTLCVTLDRLLEGIDVDVLKVDVEETGPVVLRSGLEMLAVSQPLVAIEAEPAEQPAVAELLEPLGYVCLGRFCATPTFLWDIA